MQVCVFRFLISTNNNENSFELSFIYRYHIGIKVLYNYDYDCRSKTLVRDQEIWTDICDTVPAKIKRSLASNQIESCKFHQPPLKKKKVNCNNLIKTY